MVAETPRIRLVVAESEAGERLDRILAGRELGHSRTALQRWIDEARVWVDGAVATRKSRPIAGQVIEVAPAPPAPSEAIPEDIPLAILYEDAHLIVLDKPPGLVVHPAPGHPTGTLVNALLFHRAQDAAFAPRAGGDTQRPGIVHRLDKDTSGVMVVAKTEPAREGLIALFQRHDIERSYQAIVVGDPPLQRTFDTLHGRHPVDRKRFTTKVARGKRAVTHVEVIERIRGAAVVRCTLRTGRTHQIRVHLAEGGFPILGDPVYGTPPKDPELRKIARGLGRQALHAAVLGFVHPITKEPLRFETTPPADFEAARNALRPR